MEKSTYKIYKSTQELETARLKEAANKTYTERFYTLTKLIRISKMISGAKIILLEQQRNLSSKKD